jgi:lysophospholipase L1-like esterase
VTVLLVPYLEDDPLIAQGVGIVRALAEHFGFAVVTAEGEFRAAGLQGLRIRAEDPVHPNAQGHAALAQALVRALSGTSSAE